MDIYTNSYKYIARVASSSASRNADARDASHRRARGATDDDAAHKISRAKRGHFFGALLARTFGVGMRMVRTFGVGNRHTDMGTHAQGTHHAPWIPRGANGARARSPRGCVDGLNDVDSARRRRYSRDDGED